MAGPRGPAAWASDRGSPRAGLVWPIEPAAAAPDAGLRDQLEGLLAVPPAWSTCRVSTSWWTRSAPVRRRSTRPRRSSWRARWVTCWVAPPSCPPCSWTSCPRTWWPTCCGFPTRTSRPSRAGAAPRGSRPSARSTTPSRTSATGVPAPGGAAGGHGQGGLLAHAVPGDLPDGGGQEGPDGGLLAQGDRLASVFLIGAPTPGGRRRRGGPRPRRDLLPRGRLDGALPPDQRGPEPPGQPGHRRPRPPERLLRLQQEVRREQRTGTAAARPRSGPSRR